MANIRKIALVVAASVLALVAPAAASGEVWTHEGAPLELEAEVEAVGPIAFGAGFGFAHGTVEITKKMKPGGTGEVTKFVVTGCKGTGPFAGQHCTVEAKNLPWIIHIVPGKTQTTKVEIVVGFPTLPAAVAIVGNIVGTPDNLFEMSSEELSGEEITANGMPGTISGELSLSPAGTYGIE